MMSAARLPDWPLRLAAYVEAARALQFAWAAHDCCTWAAGAVEAITGVRPPLPLYDGQRSATRLLRAMGGLQVAVMDVLGTPVAPALARRGDVVLLEQLPGRHALAVCVGHAWAAPGPHGLAFGPLAEAVAAWRVG